MIDKKLIREAGNSIDKSVIIAFENQYKVHFPNDYFEFLLKYGNMGIILKQCFLEVTGDIITNIHGLEYIKGGLDWIRDLEAEYNNEYVVSDKMIPIAKTVLDIFYCIDKDLLDTTIYRINFEVVDNKFISPIADSFTDFLTQLAHNPNL